MAVRSSSPLSNSAWCGIPEVMGLILAFDGVSSKASHRIRLVSSGFKVAFPESLFSVLSWLGVDRSDYTLDLFSLRPDFDCCDSLSSSPSASYFAPTLPRPTPSRDPVARKTQRIPTPQICGHGDQHKDLRGGHT